MEFDSSNWYGVLTQESTCIVKDGLKFPYFMLLGCLLFVSVEKVNRPFHISGIHKDGDTWIFIVSDSVNTPVCKLRIWEPGETDAVCIGIVSDTYSSGSMTFSKEFFAWLKSIPSDTELAEDALILRDSNVLVHVSESFNGVKDGINSSIRYNNKRVDEVIFDDSFYPSQSSGSSSSAEPSTETEYLKELTVRIGEETYTFTGDLSDIVGILTCSVEDPDNSNGYDYANPLRVLTGSPLQLKRICDR